jgi:hypothetical protein
MPAAVSPSSEFARWWGDGLQSSFAPTGLIFLKYVSDAFEEKHAQLEKEPVADPEEKAIRVNLKKLEYVR